MTFWIYQNRPTLTVGAIYWQKAWIKNSLVKIPKQRSNILNENLLKISRNQCSTNYSSSLWNLTGLWPGRISLLTTVEIPVWFGKISRIQFSNDYSDRYRFYGSIRWESHRLWEMFRSFLPSCFLRRKKSKMGAITIKNLCFVHVTFLFIWTYMSKKYFRNFIPLLQNSPWYVWKETIR